MTAALAEARAAVHSRSAAHRRRESRSATASSRSAIPTPARWSAPCPRRPLEDVRARLRIARGYQAEAHALRALPHPEAGRRAPAPRAATRSRDLITLRIGPVAEGLASTKSGRVVRRAALRRQRGAGRRRPGVLVRPHAARQEPPRLHAARAAAGRDHRDHAVQPPDEPGDHKVAPSIATNNRMVLKPEEKTPLAAYYLADLLYEAGLPPRDAVGRHRRPARDRRRAAHQPGRRPGDLHRRRGDRQVHRRQGGLQARSPRAGRQRPHHRDGGRRPRGGRHARGQGSYKNSGQRCTAVKRMLVHESVADRFVELLVEKTQGAGSTATRWIRASTWAR